jgi:hypothetical protein
LKLARLGAALGAFFFLASLLVYARAARADAALPAGVRVVISGCSLRFNELTLQNHVRVELLAAGVHSVRAIDPYVDNMIMEEEPATLATLRVTFPDCEEASDQVRLGIADRKTGKHIERTLAVSDVPEAMQARAIALVLTELLRSEWERLSTAKAPVKPAPRAAIPPRAAQLRAARILREQEEEEARQRLIAFRYRIEWLAVGHVYPKTHSGTLNTVLALSKLFAPRARLQVGGSLAGGASQGGNVQLSQATFRALLAVVARVSNPTVEIGTLLELGWANVRGDYLEGEHGPLVSASGHVTLRIRAAEAMEALITGQLGIVIAQVTELGPPPYPLGFAGPMFAIGLGIASWL